MKPLGRVIIPLTARMRKRRRRTVIYKQGRWRYQGREYPTLKAALLAAWPEGRR